MHALRLTEEEATEARALLATAGVDSTTGLNALLGAWARLVHDVERGYDDSIYEYTNDLSARDRLHQLTTSASSGLREKLQMALSPLDERFTAATEPARLPLNGGAGETAAWWSRIPTNRVGELAEDLVDLGYCTR